MKVLVFNPTPTDGIFAGQLHNISDIKEVSNPITSSVSRYQHNHAYVNRNEPLTTYLGTTPEMKIDKSSNDYYFTTTVTTRWDIISATHYGTPIHWWALAAANNIYDPLKPIEVGTMIRVPSMTDLYKLGGLLSV